MEDYDDSTPHWFNQEAHSVPPTQRRSRRKWLALSGIALAFLLALLAIGGHLSASSTAQAASLSSGSTQSVALGQSNTGSGQVFVFNGNAQQRAGANNGPQGPAFGPGAQGQGQCESLTVSSVSGSTIVAKTASGASVTVHTTSSTKYSQAGKSVTASAIKVGTVISVMGTHNSDGSITATSIDIG